MTDLCNSHIVPLSVIFISLTMYDNLVILFMITVTERKGKERKGGKRRGEGGEGGVKMSGEERRGKGSEAEKHMKCIL